MSRPRRESKRNYLRCLTASTRNPLYLSSNSQPERVKGLPVAVHNIRSLWPNIKLVRISLGKIVQAPAPDDATHESSYCATSRQNHRLKPWLSSEIGKRLSVVERLDHRCRYASNYGVGCNIFRDHGIGSDDRVFADSYSWHN